MMRNDDVNRISGFMYCGQCLQEKPDDQSPKEWGRLAVGMTDDGVLQVWCVRHDRGVVEIKVEGYED